MEEQAMPLIFDFYSRCESTVYIAIYLSNLLIKELRFLVHFQLLQRELLQLPSFTIFPVDLLALLNKSDQPSIN